MANVQALISDIYQELNAFSVPEEPRELYNPIRYTLSNGGKRMRPLLVLMGCKLFREDLSDAIHPALGIEVFHNFTLLHDDIMDNAPLRRGMESVHKKWNSNIAILSGDVMMIMAYQELSNTRADVLPQVLSVFNKTAIEVCEGQQLDMNFETQAQVSIDDYLEMIRLKTAVVLGAGLKVGAIIGGADAYQADLLYDFGLNTGLAFQLQDDILDVYGNSDTVGKQKGGDIISNKKTFLLLKAMELAKDGQKKELEDWMSRTDTNEAEKVTAVLKIYDQLGIRQFAEHRITEHNRLAQQSLSKVKANKGWLEALASFTEELLTRDH